MPEPRRWTIWRLRVGGSFGRWLAEQQPHPSFQPMTETIEVMPVAEHEEAVAALRAECHAALGRAADDRNRDVDSLLDRAEAAEAWLAKAREITPEMVRRALDRYNECASSGRPVGHSIQAWMRAALEAALGQEPAPERDEHGNPPPGPERWRTALAYLADPESWAGNPHDLTTPMATLHGHDSPFELARWALGQEERDDG